MDINNINNMFPKRKMSPAAEMLCVCLAAASIPFVIVGFAVFKTSKWVCDLGRTMWAK